MPFKLSPRDQLIALGLGAVVVFALFVLFALRPQLAGLTEMRQQQVAEAAKLDDNKLKLQRLDAIRADAAQIEADRIALARRLPQDAEIPSLIIDIQKLANDADLDLQSIDIGEPTAIGGYAEIALSLDGQGSFYTVVDFLYRLEKMTREVVIDDFSLGAGEYPLLNLSLKARAFKLIEAVPSQPLAAGAAPTSGESGGEPLDPPE